jgi:hypothetical protein
MLVLKILEVQVGQFLLSCKWQVSRSVVVQEQDTTCDIPATIFFPNILQLHQQRWAILRVDILALWKIINEEDTILIPKNQGENFSSGLFTRNFFAG